jgi:Ca2+-binding EF-hand superfamily protein
MMGDGLHLNCHHKDKGATDVASLAHAFQLPLATVHEAADLFRGYAELPGYADDEDVLRDGLMNEDSMYRLAKKIGEKMCIEDHSVSAQEIMGVVDQDIDGSVDFQEFALWYHERSFLEYMTLSKEEIEVRRVGTRLGLDIYEMDQYKALFDKFDENGSGLIDEHEFTEVLHVLMKIPKGERIPVSRIHHFWQECDLNGNGTVDLFEFVSFYIKNFSQSYNPMEDYYKAIRRVPGR